MTQRRVRPVARPAYGRPASGTLAARRSPRRQFQLGRTPRRVAIGLGSVAVLWLLLARIFQVATVSVRAPARTGEIRAEVQKLVAANRRQANLLTLSTDELAAKLQGTDPMLKDVRVTRHWPGTLNVSASIKSPGIGWSSGNQAYLLDRDGTVIGSLPPNNDLPVVTDTSNVPVEVGKKVATARFIAFVTGIAADLPPVGLQVSHYEVQETTLDLYATTNKGYKLIFDTSRPPADEVGDLKLVLDTLAAGRRNPNEYIDLRVAGKAYYR